MLTHTEPTLDLKSQDSDISFFLELYKNVDRRESLCIYISAVWLTACRETMELLIKSRRPSERKRGC